MGGPGSQNGGLVVRKILSVICSNMQFFFTKKRHIITKFSSQMPSYTREKFSLGYHSSGGKLLTGKTVTLPLAPLEPSVY